MSNVEEKLAEITNNFKDDPIGIRCHSRHELEEASGIFNKYYNNVNYNLEECGNSYLIKCSDKKSLKESLKLFEDDNDDIEFGEFDDPDDDMDLSELNLDTIDDASEVKDADQITILKKRAADLSKKWFEIYQQITDLAKNMDLVVSHDDKLNIEISKGDGKKVSIEADRKKLDKAVGLDDNKEDNNSEIDDSFGPSEYEDRANKLGSDDEIKEALEKNNTVNEYPWNPNNGTLDLNQQTDPNELYIDEKDIDDDF